MNEYLNAYRLHVIGSTSAVTKYNPHNFSGNLPNILTTEPSEDDKVKTEQKSNVMWKP